MFSYFDLKIHILHLITFKTTVHVYYYFIRWIFNKYSIRERSLSGESWLWEFCQQKLALIGQYLKIVPPCHRPWLKIFVSYYDIKSGTNVAHKSMQECDKTLQWNAFHPAFIYVCFDTNNASNIDGANCCQYEQLLGTIWSLPLTTLEQLFILVHIGSLQTSPSLYL